VYDFFEFSLEMMKTSVQGVYCVFFFIGLLKASIPVVEKILSAPAEEAQAHIGETLRQFCEAENHSYPGVMSTLRVSITGSKVSKQDCPRFMVSWCRITLLFFF